MAEEVTNEQQLEVLRRQWAIAAELLGARFNSEAYEDMSAYLLGRDALEEAPEMARRVEALDRQFVQALAYTSTEWQRELDDMMSRMHMADFPWWVRLLHAGEEERARLEPLASAAGAR